MNYIKQLQKTVAQQKAEIAALEAGLRDLLIYVGSEKFTACEGDLRGYVHIRDISIRIRELQFAATEAANNENVLEDNHVGA